MGPVVGFELPGPGARISEHLSGGRAFKVTVDQVGDRHLALGGPGVGVVEALDDLGFRGQPGALDLQVEVGDLAVLVVAPDHDLPDAGEEFAADDAVVGGVGGRVGLGRPAGDLVAVGGEDRGQGAAELALGAGETGGQGLDAGRDVDIEALDISGADLALAEFEVEAVFRAQAVGHDDRVEQAEFDVLGLPGQVLAIGQDRAHIEARSGQRGRVVPDAQLQRKLARMYAAGLFRRIQG